MAMIKLVDGRMVSAPITNIQHHEEGARSGTAYVDGKQIEVYNSIVDGFNPIWTEQITLKQHRATKDIKVGIEVNGVPLLPRMDVYPGARMIVIATGLPGKYSEIRGAGETIEEAVLHLVQAIIRWSLPGQVDINQETDRRATIDVSFMNRENFDVRLLAQGGDLVRSYTNEPLIEVLSILEAELASLRGAQSEEGEHDATSR